MKIEKFLDSLENAISLVGAEIERAKQGDVIRVPIQQLELVRNVLNRIEEQVRSKSLPLAQYHNLGLGQMIADSWPLDCQLGGVVLEVEDLYRKLQQ